VMPNRPFCFRTRKSFSETHRLFWREGDCPIGRVTTIVRTSFSVAAQSARVLSNSQRESDLPPRSAVLGTYGRGPTLWQYSIVYLSCLNAEPLPRHGRSVLGDPNSTSSGCSSRPHSQNRQTQRGDRPRPPSHIPICNKSPTSLLCPHRCRVNGPPTGSI